MIRVVEPDEEIRGGGIGFTVGVLENSGCSLAAAIASLLVELTLFRLPPTTVLLALPVMYLSRSSLARLVRVEARDKRREPLMILSAELHPVRYIGGRLVFATVGGDGGML